MSVSTSLPNLFAAAETPSPPLSTSAPLTLLTETTLALKESTPTAVVVVATKAVYTVDSDATAAAAAVAVTTNSGAPGEVSCGEYLRILSTATVWGVVEMLSRVRSAFYNVVQNLDAFPVEDDQSDNGTANGVGQSNDSRKLKFSYSRPQFLQLDSSEEIQVKLYIYMNHKCAIKYYNE